MKTNSTLLEKKAETKSAESSIQNCRPATLKEILAIPIIKKAIIQAQEEERERIAKLLKNYRCGKHKKLFKALKSKPNK